MQQWSHCYCFPGTSFAFFRFFFFLPLQLLDQNVIREPHNALFMCVSRMYVLFVQLYMPTYGRMKIKSKIKCTIGRITSIRLAFIEIHKFWGSSLPGRSLLASSFSFCFIAHHFMWIVCTFYLHNARCLTVSCVFYFLISYEFWMVPIGNRAIRQEKKTAPSQFHM